jgi:hypothetical protein
VAGTHQITDPAVTPTKPAHRVKYADQLMADPVGHQVDELLGLMKSLIEMPDVRTATIRRLDLACDPGQCLCVSDPVAERDRRVVIFQVLLVVPSGHLVRRQIDETAHATPH